MHSYTITITGLSIHALSGPLLHLVWPFLPSSIPGHSHVVLPGIISEAVCYLSCAAASRPLAQVYSSPMCMNPWNTRNMPALLLDAIVPSSTGHHKRSFVPSTCTSSIHIKLSGANAI
jgi:hypothetical protein